MYRWLSLTPADIVGAMRTLRTMTQPSAAMGDGDTPRAHPLATQSAADMAVPAPSPPSPAPDSAASGTARGQDLSQDLSQG